MCFTVRVTVMEYFLDFNVWITRILVVNVFSVFFMASETLLLATVVQKKKNER